MGCSAVGGHSCCKPSSCSLVCSVTGHCGLSSSGNRPASPPGGEVGFPGVWILVGGRRAVDEKMLEQKRQGRRPEVGLGSWDL